MTAIPVALLRETTERRLYLGPIEAAGYRTVAAVAAAGLPRLRQIQGVGPQTASQVIAAARQLEATLARSVRVRFDPDGRPDRQTALLGALYMYDVARSAVEPLRDATSQLMTRLAQLIDAAQPATSRMQMLVTRGQRRESVMIAVDQL
jgi:hypothetical protein